MVRSDSGKTKKEDEIMSANGSIKNIAEEKNGRNCNNRRYV